MSSIEESSLALAWSNALSAQTDLIQQEASLSHAHSNSIAKGLPPIAISPSQGQQLSILCRLVGAKNILELGTLGGYSTIWFAKSVPGVKVTSIEFNPKHRDVALENVKAAGCSLSPKSDCCSLGLW